ncbi:MAG TPA: hypothetical protein VMU43_06915 [Candidatus Acidoferrum sp.]|nr:hypothetical protein [Candidatus Acidoferrum sp.]
MSLRKLRRSITLSVLPATLAAICFLGLSACGGGGGNNNLTPSISITPMQTSVAVGVTADFQAIVTNSSSAVIWEVNGVAGGNSTVGTIQSDGSIANQGDYTAPAAVPSSNPVTVTAVLSSNKGIVSNSASVSITAAQGLTINPGSTNVAAGLTATFTAAMNGSPDTNVTWSVSSAKGGDVGTIGASTGVYTAPFFPPPGQQVVVKAVDNTDNTKSGTAAVTVTYGQKSLNGTYAFAYTGDDGSGYFSVAGSFAASGTGTITGGVADSADLGQFAAGVPITGGSYTVSANGATVINLTINGTTLTLQASLMNNQHGLVIEYDNTATGSGTIDLQNPADFTISGPFVFTFSGADGIGPGPLGVAGKFTASSGNIPNTNAIVDVNDSGDVNNNCPNLNCNVVPGLPDTTLSGSYQLDQNNLAYGRGTMTLNASYFSTFTFSGTTQVTFAFYVVDHTHIHLIEIDNNAFTNGDIYQGASGNGGFGVTILPKGNYPFAVGGASSNGAYVAGGIYTSDGNGNVTGGIFDNNSGGQQINSGLAINQCAYTVDSATGRVDVLLSLKSGNGCTTPSTTVDEFAVYPTALSQASPSEPSAVMVELDNNFVTSGISYAQNGTPVGASGSFAFNITGQGAFKNTPGTFQQDGVGILALAGTSATSGTLFVNNFGSVQGGPLVPSQSTLAAPSTLGRGTAKLVVNLSPNATYNLVYYYIDPDTYLLVDLDTNRIANGVIADQF